MPSKARQEFETKVIELIKTIDKSGTNSELYIKRFRSMSDGEFDKYIEELRTGKRKLSIKAPNMISRIKMTDLIEAQKQLGLEIRERIRMYDHVNDRHYLTRGKYHILLLPIRRQQQDLEKKISIPSGDTITNLETGQVSGPDRGSSFSLPQSAVVASRGCEIALSELINIRGGNVLGYADFKAQLEETGEASINAIDPNTRPRSLHVTAVYLRSMMIENTFDS